MPETSGTLSLNPLIPRVGGAWSAVNTMPGNDDDRGRVRRWTGFALIAIMAFGAMAGGAAAHRGTEEHGTITWHDSKDGPPQTHTGGKYSRGAVNLTCEFWVKGYNMSDDDGHIGAEFNYRSGNPEVTYVEVAGNWTGEANESGGWDFVAGPFTLSENGTVRGFASTGEENHSGREDRQNFTHTTEDHRISYTACQEEQGDEEKRPACPKNVQAQALPNESVRLTWNASEDADTYHVYRGEDHETREHVAQVNDTSYTDTETEAQQTYRYEVRAEGPGGENPSCPSVAVTAIPFFGNPALVAMAAVGSIGAVAVVGRAR